MKNRSIIGTYKGKCCDAEVTNSNGMFLGKDLFETLINSDEYKQALQNGYYIGFLGHPEDPDCQDFKNGCIVMTDMELLDNGDIYGEFNVIDTPVGRIVKSFIDAGVNFGISIRGVGDVDNNGSVDPDSFVFRGFDLVSFPAYSDCVPEFQAIAASEDLNKKKAYQKVCKTVKRDAKKITSSQSIEIIRDQFNENSPEYQELDEIYEAMEDDVDYNTYVEVLEQKVEGLTDIIVDKVQQNQELYAELGEVQEALYCNERASKRANQISASQTSDLLKQIDILQSRNSKLKRDIKAAKRLTNSTRKTISKLENENRKLVRANSELEAEIHNRISETKTLNSKVNSLNSTNLTYKTEVKAHKSELAEKDTEIESLKSKLHETVVANKRLDKGTSNREVEIEELRSEIKACERIILDYQQAYADMCAYSVGVELDNISISANTTVDELKSIIYGSASSYAASKSSAYVAADFDQLNEDTEDVLDDPVVL